MQTNWFNQKLTRKKMNLTFNKSKASLFLLEFDATKSKSTQIVNFKINFMNTVYLLNNMVSPLLEKLSRAHFFKNAVTHIF